ncbi:hypothetical protein [Paracoccus seriniphilus]|uniref:hypothetical protein n=1 Tax=Paracoccus seriniphilus TaxID=184748 RepID=UPI000B76E4CE|nr:hypothetical protein [Paracoccus seriniphilus]WCR13366.1 hypothetical protein JHW44_10555 [Paracoccus seriniphilus]
MTDPSRADRHGPARQAIAVDGSALDPEWKHGFPANDSLTGWRYVIFVPHLILCAQPIMKSNSQSDRSNQPEMKFS